VTVTFHPGLRGAKIGVVMKLITGRRQGAAGMIRHLVSWSTSRRADRGGRLFEAIGTPAAPAHPNLSGSWVRPLGDREVGECRR